MKLLSSISRASVFTSPRRHFGVRGLCSSIVRRAYPPPTHTHTHLGVATEGLVSNPPYTSSILAPDTSSFTYLAVRKVRGGKRGKGGEPLSIAMYASPYLIWRHPGTGLSGGGGGGREGGREGTPNGEAYRHGSQRTPCLVPGRRWPGGSARSPGRSSSTRSRSGAWPRTGGPRPRRQVRER